MSTLDLDSLERFDSLFVASGAADVPLSCRRCQPKRQAKFRPLRKCRRRRTGLQRLAVLRRRKATRYSHPSKPLRLRHLNHCRRPRRSLNDHRSARCRRSEPARARGRHAAVFTLDRAGSRQPDSVANAGCAGVASRFRAISSAKHQRFASTRRNARTFASAGALPGLPTFSSTTRKRVIEHCGKGISPRHSGRRSTGRGSSTRRRSTRRCSTARATSRML